MSPRRRPVCRPRTTGFSLVELILFIVIISILTVGLYSSFSNALRNSGQMNSSLRASQLATERLELILAQHKQLGFAGFVNPNYDPCKMASPQAVCTATPAGFTVNSNLALDWNADINYKVVTVSVTGAAPATLTALIASY